MNTQKLTEELRRDEGFRKTVYLDSEGIETIGVGRNLRDRGLSEDEINLLLRNDIETAILDAIDVLPCSFHSLTDARQRVLVNMCFNLGRPRLRKFKKMLAAVEREDYETAAAEMLNSKWARQVGPRAVRLADMMRAGE